MTQPWPIQALHVPVHSSWLRPVCPVQSDAGRGDLGVLHLLDLKLLAAGSLCEDRARSHIDEPGGKLSPAGEPCQTFILDLPATKKCHENFLCLSHPVYGILLWQQELIPPGSLLHSLSLESRYI